MSDGFHADTVSISREDGVLMVAFGCATHDDEAPYLILQRALEPDDQDVLHGMDAVYMEWSSPLQSHYGDAVSAEIGEGRFSLVPGSGMLSLGVDRIDVTFDVTAVGREALVRAVDELLVDESRTDRRLEVLRRHCHRLLETDHQDHEAIIGFLQRQRNPFAVPFLLKAISLKPELRYLEYDDDGAYYKKCLWALRAIATEDAIAGIEACAESPDAVLREQARYRLEQIRAGR
jgi:hypothetical protein